MSSAAIVANPKKDIDQIDSHSSVRSCEFCGSCTTPTWRRGPSGKGSLCNACGIKWRLKKRTSPVASNNKKENDASSSASTNNKKAKSKKLFSSPIPTIAKKTNNNSTSSPIKSIDRKPATNSNNNGQQQLQQTNKERPAINPDSNDKRYYCKFCDKTFASTHFKNSQQFGAHCSNCSRRPRGGNSNMVNDAPSSSQHDEDEDDDNYSDEMNVDMESDYLEEDSNQHHHQQQQQQHALQQQQHHADDLLSHLLHVVANQLVEENELISIRGELAVIKEDVHIQKEQQQSSIVELRTQLHRDVEEISAMIAEDARQKQRVAAAQLCELDQYWREIHSSLEQHLYSSHTSVFVSSPSAHQLSA